MKILHVTPSYFPAFRFGGPIQSVHLLNKGLIDEGIEVSVVTTNAGLDAEQQIPLKEWTKQQRVPVMYFPFAGYEHYNFSPSLFFFLLKEVKKYDLIHITAVWNFPVWAAAFACRLNNKPYLISPRGTIYPETIAIKSAGLKKLYYKLMAEKTLKNAEAIHYTATDESARVEEYLKLGVKPLVIANGVDLSEFKESVTKDELIKEHPFLQDKNYILFLGRINKKKGLNILYEAFANVIQKYPGLILVVAGPDNDGYKKELEKLAEKLNIKDHIYYPGEFNGKTKISAYKNAFFFALSSYSENFGMSVVEAMASGTAVLISDMVGIAPEITANNAGVVVKTTAESVASGMLKLIGEPEHTATVAKNGLNMVNQYYDIKAVSHKFAVAYKEIIQNFKK